MGRSLGQMCWETAEEFTRLGGTEAMAKGEPCLTIAQAEYLGQWKAFSRVLYELGQPSWEGFDFKGHDQAYEEYV